MRTLYSYLSRDLVKVTLMALVVLTMILTVLGAIEPMRKYGLTGLQILNLFGYLVPVVLPLTLPISALFGAAFVYGRFGQTNEFLAAKASGISAIRLLGPAIALGVVVTVASLLISNLVAPAMAEQLGRAVEENLGGLTYQGLRSRGYVDLRDGRFLHAAAVDRNCREIRGIVAAKVKKKGVVEFVIIPSASARIEKVDGKPRIRIEVTEAVITRSDRYDFLRMERPELDPIEPPDLAKEKASWYDWNRLHTTLRNPALNGKIRGLLTGIHRGACAEEVARPIASTINSGRGHSFDDGSDKYVLVARAAKSGERGVVKLYQGYQRVSITVRRSGKGRETIFADEGEISISASPDAETATAAIVLRGQVRAQVDGGPPRPLRRDQWRVAGLGMASGADGADHVANAVITAEPYTFSDGRDQYTLRAGWAELNDSGSVVLSPIRPVAVVVTSPTRKKIVTADSGTVSTVWNSRREEMTTSIVLGGGPVTVRNIRWPPEDVIGPGGKMDIGRHRDWKSSGLSVPPDIAEAIRSIDLAEICRRPEDYSTNEKLVAYLKKQVSHLQWEIVAEMHARIALGLSCCLLVAVGAALGLIFRGGQVLSAFAISVVPAVVAYVMVIMGKQMVTNPDVGPDVGRFAIWSGNILLILANTYIYSRVMRR